MFCAAISANVLIWSPAGQRFGGQRMADDLGLENLIQLGQALDVIDVGMRGDQHPAVRQRKIHLPDQLDDLVDRFVEADIDQQPIGAVVNQIDIAAQPLAGLVIDFDDMRENRFPLEHTKRPDECHGSYRVARLLRRAGHFRSRMAKRQAKRGLDRLAGLSTAKWHRDCKPSANQLRPRLSIQGPQSSSILAVSAADSAATIAAALRDMSDTRVANPTRPAAARLLARLSTRERASSAESSGGVSNRGCGADNKRANSS